MDIEENQEVYSQPSGQKKDCGFPIMGLVAVVNHSHGGIEGVVKCFKTTMNMEHFAVKSPEIAHLTLQMMVITYNLIRCIMQRAALEVEKTIHEMSFQGVRYTISTSHESFRSVAQKPILKSNLYEKLIKTCADHVLNIRPYRREPRARKRRPKNYQLLTSSRKTFREIPHRSRSRKIA